MTGRMLSIVGGGWSMASIDHNKIPGEVIAVNDSIFYLERTPNFAVSMDRLWTQNRWSNDPLNKGGIVGLSVPTYIRRSALKSSPWMERPWGWLHPYECDIHAETMSPSPHELHGPNSGQNALNLAYIMQPSELFLFGFDMCRNGKGEAYWFPDYPWARAGGGTSDRRYVEWQKFMRAAAEQFKELRTKVYNVSPMSAIPYFEKISPKELGIEK